MSNGFWVNTVSVNASTGAFTTLFGTVLSKAIELLEDFSANAGIGQGLTYNLIDWRNTTNPQNPVWVGPFSLGPQTEPIKLGDLYQIHAPYGSSVANGPNVGIGVGVTNATPYIQIKSAGSATTVRVTEFE